ncbi:MAG: hypothetical protein IKT27_04730, partial [Clostridia bacterium]|nr:hypothetical protein [Clostridia bacterium]
LNGYALTYDLKNCTTSTENGVILPQSGQFKMTINKDNGYNMLPSIIQVEGVASDNYTWEYATGEFVILDCANITTEVSISCEVDHYYVYEYGQNGAAENTNALYAEGKPYKYYVEIGEYPQSAVSEELNATLNTALENSEITIQYDSGRIMQYASYNGIKYAYYETPYVNGNTPNINWYRFEPVRWIVAGSIQNNSQEFAFNPDYDLHYNKGNKKFTYNSNDYGNVLLVSEKGLEMSWDGGTNIKENPGQWTKLDFDDTLNSMQATMNINDNYISPQTLITNDNETEDKFFILANLSNDNFLYSTFFTDATAIKPVNYETDYATEYGQYIAGYWLRSIEWYMQIPALNRYNLKVYYIDNGGGVSSHPYTGYCHLLKPCFVLNLGGGV